MVKRLALVWLLLALTNSGAAASRQNAAAPALSAAEVLDRVRAAVRYDKLRARENGYVGEGTARANGVDASYRAAFAPDGRFYSRVDGPLGTTVGFDGTRGWAVDWSGMPRPLELEDLDEEQLAAWVYSGRWLAEDGPFAVTIAELQKDPKRVALGLELRTGPLEATIYVDRSTWLPSSMVRQSDSGEEVLRLEDYREVMGFMFPFRLVRTIGEVTDRYDLRSLEAAAADVASLYAPVTVRPADTRFRADAPAALEVRRVPSGHLLVKPRVEGKDIGWFILDSGAGAMVVDRKAADRVGMPALGEVHVNGVAGSETARFRLGETFELGPMTVSKLRYVDLNLSFLTQAFGVPIGGIVGYDIFARAVVELGLSGPTVNLHDPERYRLEGAEWQPIAFSHKHPAVRARFEGGREGVFRLDSGSDQTVTFHAPTVERYKMLDGRRTEPSRSGGVGGSSESRTGTLDWFELGGRRFEKPVVEFATTQQGAFADDYMAGNVGTGFLSAFKVVFDYTNKRIAFVPLSEKAT
jgi:hypothetical protein